MTETRGLIVGLAVAVLANSSADGQRTPECRFLCRVTVEEAVTLGDAGDGAIGWGQQVVKLGGLHYVLHAESYTRVQTFAEDGSFVRALGHPGEGPEEFKVINNIEVGPDGNLWVVDQGNHAVKILSPAGTVLNSHPLRFAVSRGGVVVLPDSSMIVNALVPVAHLVGMWTHRWHLTRGHMWSAEDDDPVARGFVRQRIYAVDGEDLWVARRWGEYRLERRRLSDGGLVQQIDIQRPWFDQYQEEVPAEGAKERGGEVSLLRVRATISDIRVIDGLIWVLGHTPDRDWQHAEDDGYRNLGVLLDNVIDIFEPSSGRLLVSARLDLPNAAAVSFLDDETLVAHQTNQFVDKVAIYRVRLRGPVPRELNR